MLAKPLVKDRSPDARIKPDATLPPKPLAADVRPFIPTPPVNVEQSVPTCSIRNMEIIVIRKK